MRNRPRTQCSFRRPILRRSFGFFLLLLSLHYFEMERGRELLVLSLRRRDGDDVMRILFQFVCGFEIFCRARRIK